MSWGIYHIGKKEAVIKAVQAGPSWGSMGEQEELARAFIVDELRKYNDGDAVVVNCGGHTDSTSRNIKIEINKTVITE